MKPCRQISSNYDDMVCSRSYSRLTRPPRQSFFLLGVRGVGKSTWARRQFPDALRIDLLDEARFQDYLVDPSLFAAELASVPPGSRVVVDEIQRLPNLLNEVHRFIEERQLVFALLGSSARKLKAAGVNLLEGRALRRTMYPLTPAEQGWVLHLLRAHGEESDLYEDLRYWAPHPANRTEVDFLLRRGDEFAAIEVKSRSRYHTGMLPGLRAVAGLPGMVRRVLVYGGRRSFRTQDGIDVWPVERLHRALADGTLWP